MKLPQISQRLQMVVSQISCATLADVGTDHAYIPIYSVCAGNVAHAVAMDVNPGPLKRAQENVRAFDCEGKVETRLGNGLLPLQPSEVECASIAGMGGMLIVDILRNSPRIVQSLKQLVLQPQHDADKVRRYLHSIGFRITNEEMVFEEQYYTVIQAEPGTEPAYTDNEYLLGKVLLRKRNAVFQNFAAQKVLKFTKILRSIEKNSNDDEKRREIMNEMELYKGVVDGEF